MKLGDKMEDRSTMVVQDPARKQSDEFNWGMRPERVTAACICSRHAQMKAPKGSRERDGPLRRLL